MIIAIWPKVYYTYYSYKAIIFYADSIYRQKGENMYCTRKVTDDLTWVGADDRRLVCFEGVYGVPDGVSYNSYLLQDEKTVLFDTVDKAVATTFFENVKHALGGRALDYLVITHMEPDHAATVEDLVVRHPELKIICNQKIKTMLEQFFDFDMTDRLILMKEGDSFSSGKHEFTFVMAPMVHWPEVMMVYDKTEKMLFSADAFGVFGALNGRLFADETDFFKDDIDEARRYYTNIVGKYGPQVQAVLKKAAGLELKYVCPLHGYVWRKNFGEYLEKYMLWSSYAPEEKNVMLAYASVYGHTENTANILASKLVERGVKVRMYDTSVTPSSYIVSDAFRCSHLVFAATTYNAGVFVTMENLLHDIAAHNLQGRKVCLIENGSWAPTSGKLMAGMLSGLKNTEFISDPFSIRSALKENQLDALEALADTIAKDINPEVPEAVIKDEEKKLELDKNAFRKFTYGVQLLTTAVDGKDYGCIINSAVQMASGEPKKVCLSVINKNLTREMLEKSGKFNISILTEDAPFELFQRFGLQSGRDNDKFEGFEYDDKMSNGIRYLPKYANAVLSCVITDIQDLGASTLFTANVVEAKCLSDAPSCSYDYYHSHIKPKKPVAAVQKEGWVCKVCGYFYEGSELPDDYICPLCKHGKDDFEYVGAEKPKKKGWVCTVCGYFYEGENLPEDYICPLCNHGAEDFEPAER